jgi:hypothetical protein
LSKATVLAAAGIGCDRLRLRFYGCLSLPKATALAAAGIGCDRLRLRFYGRLSLSKATSPHLCCHLGE